MANPKKKRAVTQQQDTIKPTYKNMRMFNNIRAQENPMGSGNTRPTTARDTANYNSGFNYGIKYMAPNKGFKNEGYMFKAGRFEGQNNPSSINQTSKVKNKTKRTESVKSKPKVNYGKALYNLLRFK
ncbi:MAG: hypothetical protein ABF265_07835 [Polaribacter sp.]